MGNHLLHLPHLLRLCDPTSPPLPLHCGLADPEPVSVAAIGMPMDETPAQRTHRLRLARRRRSGKRRRTGRRVLRVEAYEHWLAAALIESGRLTAEEALATAKLEEALAKVVADFCIRWVPKRPE